MRPEGSYADLMNLTREGSRRMVLRRDRVAIGNSCWNLLATCLLTISVQTPAERGKNGGFPCGL